MPAHFLLFDDLETGKAILPQTLPLPTATASWPAGLTRQKSVGFRFHAIPCSILNDVRGHTASCSAPNPALAQLLLWFCSNQFDGGDVHRGIELYPDFFSLPRGRNILYVLALSFSDWGLPQYSSFSKFQSHPTRICAKRGRRSDQRSADRLRIIFTRV